MRYAIEKLRLNQSACTTFEGTGAGITTAFPPVINGAETEVTCQRVGGTAGDTQGWSVIVTGGTSGTGELMTQGGIAKTFGGPVFMYDPDRIDLSGGDLTVENGDMWWTDPDCATATFPTINDLHFTPAFLRGPICTPSTWNQMFTAPPANVPTNSPAPPVMSGQCKVFSPGKYTSSPSLGANNYFRAGEYYFEERSCSRSSRAS